MLTRALLPDACAVPSAWNALPFVPACTSDICIPFLGVIIHSPKDRALYSLGQTPLRVLSSLPSHHDLSRQQEDLGSERSGWPQVDQLARGHGAAVPLGDGPSNPPAELCARPVLPRPVFGVRGRTGFVLPLVCRLPGL